MCELALQCIVVFQLNEHKCCPWQASNQGKNFLKYCKHCTSNICYQ